MNTSEVIAHYRTLRGMSRSELASHAGVSERQIWRYEDTAEPAAPTLPVAVKISDALGISLATLAGRDVPEVDLSGVWYSAWQTWMDDIERVEHERVTITQEGTFLQVIGEADPDHTDTGSYAWTGEWRLLRDRNLSGWYAASTEGIGSNGAVHLTMHSHGHYALGRWMGMSHDGISESGWGALARSEEVAAQSLRAIAGTVGTLKQWPDLSGVEFPSTETP
ncbi:MAG: helix-turn-helix transcriptional regulator [Mycobacterium sp.]|nr:helix-turn-helix transcriptional regulator [Mycobacterium sp.]